MPRRRKHTACRKAKAARLYREMQLATAENFEECLDRFIRARNEAQDEARARRAVR